MWKLVASLLILGWISLSGFDLVEELNDLPGQPAALKTVPDGTPMANQDLSVPLVNNMVESANRSQPVEISFGNSIQDFFYFSPNRDFRQHSQLYKLSRVLLI